MKGDILPSQLQFNSK